MGMMLLMIQCGIMGPVATFSKWMWGNCKMFTEVFFMLSGILFFALMTLERTLRPADSGDYFWPKPIANLIWE
jgi:hypothetical protein